MSAIVSAFHSRRYLNKEQEALERKQAALLVKQEEINKKEEEIKMREENCKIIEAKARAVAQMEMEIDASKSALDASWTQYNKRHEALVKKIETMNQSICTQLESARVREVDVIEKEKKLSFQIVEFEEHVAKQKALLDHKTQLIQADENDLRERRAKAVEFAAQTKKWHEELRIREEDLDVHEKNLRDMAVAEEKSKRRVKMQEDDLMKRTVELRIRVEEVQSRSEDVETQSNRLREALEAAERTTKELNQEKSALSAREARIKTKERELDNLKAQLDKDAEVIENRSQELAQREKVVAVREQDARDLSSTVIRDLERFDKLKEKLEARDEELKLREQRAVALEDGVHDWASDLHWREREIQQRGVAREIRRPVSSMEARKHFNSAIVDIQLRHAIAQYTAPAVRRSKQESPKFPSLLKEGMTTCLLEESVERLSESFSNCVTKLKLNDDIMNPSRCPGLTPTEMAKLQLCLLRERDHAVFQSIALEILGQCPINEIYASGKRVVAWWGTLERSIKDRIVSVHVERTEYLNGALNLLEQKGPSFMPASGNQSGRREVNGVASLRETPRVTPSVPTPDPM
eukprot:PhF_6_TR8730/c0_g1_i1/m.13723